MDESDTAERVGARGPLSQYKPSYCEEARKLCENGAIDVEIAEHFGVAIRTIYRWKNSYPDFAAALRVGKDAADDRVVASLYNRANGYTFDAVKIMSVPLGNGGGSEIREVPYQEHVPPDTTAMIFWLKNRRPKEWRDKQDVEHHGIIAVNIDTDPD